MLERDTHQTWTLLLSFLVTTWRSGRSFSLLNEDKWPGVDYWEPGIWHENPSLCAPGDSMPSSMFFFTHYHPVIHMFLSRYEESNGQMLTEIQSIWADVNLIILLEFKIFKIFPESGFKASLVNGFLKHFITRDRQTDFLNRLIYSNFLSDISCSISESISDEAAFHITVSQFLHFHKNGYFCSQMLYCWAMPLKNDCF